MMKPENNQYQNPYVAGAPWNRTFDVEFCMLDEYLLSRDVISMVKQLFGTQNQENLAVYVVEANWAKNNPDLAEMFFSEDHLMAEICMAVQGFITCYSLISTTSQGIRHERNVCQSSTAIRPESWAKT
jgi:hypothetical protein